MGPVVGLEEAEILGPCVLGHPLAASDDDPPAPLVLGPGTVIRAYAVLYQGVTLGPGCHVAHGAVIRENNVLGSHVSIGANCHLWPGNTIGDRTRIQAGSFLESTRIGSDVFIGPNVTFTDDPHPPCPSYLDCVGGAQVGNHASIGASVTLLPGVVVGERSLVGAGSLVRSEVPDGAVVVGSPARVVGVRSELSCVAGIYDHAYQWTDG